jgi:Uma2 family endonuclease
MPKPKLSDRYRMYVDWSEEDQKYVGLCPDLFYGGVCDSGDRLDAYARLVQIVEENLANRVVKGEPLPKPSPWECQKPPSSPDHVVETPMTVEEFDALPESALPRQYIRGKLVAAPCPDVRHAELKGGVLYALGNFLKAHPELGEIYPGPMDVVIAGPDGPERYQPDVLFYGPDRVGLLPKDDCRVPVPSIPIEILSPVTRALDLDIKRVGYARNGLPELWAVDPEAEEVLVYRLQQDAERPVYTVKPGGALRTGPLPGFELTWERLFLDDCFHP